MNARFELHLDQAAFDRWLDSQQGRYEWKEGRVVQMANVTRAHASIVRNWVVALSTRLDLSVWNVVASDFGVGKPGFTRFPDVVVERAGGDPKGRRADAPVLLIEVLSPSTTSIDLIEKPAEYMSFESLEAYVVASQDEPICWLWQRPRPTPGALDAPRPFPPRPAEVAGRDEIIEIAGLSLALPLADIYRGIGA